MQIKTDMLRWPCQVGWFVSRTTGEMIPARCKRLSCADCAGGVLARYRARLLSHGAWQIMLTVTLDGRPWQIRDAITQTASAWAVMRRWLSRHGLVAYAWCREVTWEHSWRPHVHLHCLIDVAGGYIPTEISPAASRWRGGTLNDALRRAGFGRVFRIRAIGGLDGQQKTAKYVTKYIADYVAKCTGAMPRYTRRFQSSVRALPHLRDTHDFWALVTRTGWSPADVCGVLSDDAGGSGDPCHCGCGATDAASADAVGTRRAGLLSRQLHFDYYLDKEGKTRSSRGGQEQDPCQRHGGMKPLTRSEIDALHSSISPPGPGGETKGNNRGP